MYTHCYHTLEMGDIYVQKCLDMGDICVQKCMSVQKCISVQKCATIYLLNVSMWETFLYRNAFLYRNVPLSIYVIMRYGRHMCTHIAITHTHICTHIAITHTHTPFLSTKTIQSVCGACVWCMCGEYVCGSCGAMTYPKQVSRYLS